ncbi:peptide ABC transporter substrate-binding protein [Rhodovulum sp. 12E13]|uniref:ABC transporter substrate-binding protein n=1 Tax=Rhodovulum sp. 12E13 TaxID=2203891 RepID=UPI000E17A7D1|nr:ABC transporter substrate-binding protein [Rhodovulum sp. 12E13]RDC71481.1 peptide ABC transporter substrate-binding protein [Rhodovulum sp. 12E13]
MTDRKTRYIAEQEAAYAQGRLSRRGFITALAAAGVAIPAAMSMATRVEAATPSRGGSFKIGMAHGSTTDSLDPSTYENGFTTHMGYLWGNCLTEVGPDNVLRPELAESYEPLDGGRSWVFRLRPGVEFHNGKTLTADDVIASINYHRGEDSKSAAKSVVAPITEIRKDGDLTVIFDLESPNADFPFLISDYHLLIMPSENGEVDPTSGIGTGGYAIESFEPGVRVLASRNPNYWKEGAAWFDDVEVLSIIDVTARQNALLNGEVHLIDRVDPKTVQLFSRAPGVEILDLVGYLHYTFPMRLDTAPFGDFDLRMALKLAVNKQELVDKILLGYGTIGNDHPISPIVPFAANDLPQRDYDPDQARFHYEKSGHSGPIQLSASDAAFAGAVDAAQLIQASAAVAGIEIEVVREPSDGYWSNVWNKKGWCACYWSGRPTADWMFASAYVEGSEWNDTAWRDTEAADRFNDIVVEARAELDESKRAEMYFEAQKLIHEDGGAIVPMFANYVMGKGPDVTHGENVASNWENDGNKASERWWMAS